MEDREKDIQKLALAVLYHNIESTGDYRDGGQCPFCYKDCSWAKEDCSVIEHETNCVVLIAKDLLTNYEN